MPGNIYRYKVDNEVIAIMRRFAELHRFDDRNTYKESWLKWCNENNLILSEEEDRLKKLGYVGDLKVKLYKSSRYYFGKSSIINKESNEVTDDSKDKVRRRYIGLSQNFLKCVDAYIKKNSSNEEYIKPSKLFEGFCEENGLEIEKEVKEIYPLINNREEVAEKIKKTFKNRYFRMNQAGRH